MATVEVQKPESAPLTMTIEEAAAAIGISRWSGYEAARKGELPVIRIGRRLLVPRVQLERLLAGENEEGRAA